VKTAPQRSVGSSGTMSVSVMVFGSGASVGTKRKLAVPTLNPCVHEAAWWDARERESGVPVDAATTRYPLRCAGRTCGSVACVASRWDTYSADEWNRLLRAANTRGRARERRCAQYMCSTEGGACTPGCLPAGWWAGGVVGSGRAGGMRELRMRVAPRRYHGPRGETCRRLVSITVFFTRSSCSRLRISR
jgi:hypothetical protein